MFDDSSKITIFAVGALALILSLSAQTSAPPADVETAVTTVGLPPIPLAAAPDGAPAQTRISSTTVELGDGFEAQLLYGYALDGVVVSRRTFRNDATSAVSPLDLGIVYGDMTEPGRADAVSFRAGPRVLHSRPDPDAELPPDWFDQVTNNHLIPADQTVSEALMAVEVGDRVRIRGYLVVVTGDRIRPWRSSTRRNDSTIIGGCEIILVTGVEMLAARDTAA